MSRDPLAHGPLTLREEPQEQRRDIHAALLSLRVSSIDEKARSVEATLSTDTPAVVFDMRNYRLIDEVLRAEGGKFPSQLPLLDNHYRYSLDTLLGSSREFKRSEHAWVGRIFLAEEDETADRAWNKIRQGHLSDVSIGYRAIEFTDIPPGQTQEVAGRSYTAGERTLRITTKWEPKEVSLVPIGADAQAKIRQDASASVSQDLEISEMNKRLIAYLRKLGLAEDATPEQARAFLGELRGTQRSIAGLLDYNEADEQARTSCDLAIRSLNYDPDKPAELLTPETVRQDPVTKPKATGGDSGGEPLPSPEDLARAAERERVVTIRNCVVDGVPAEMVDQAIADGWDVSRTATAFADAVRKGRGQGVASDTNTTQQAPAGHVVNRENEGQRAALQAGMLHRANLDPVADAVVYRSGLPFRRGEGGNTDLLEQAAERGYEYRDMPIVDVCREALRIDGFDSIPRGGARSVADYIGQLIATRALTSGSALSAIFTTTFSAQLLASYEATADTTGFFTKEGSVPNFKTAERARMEKGGSLTKHPRGGSADHASFDDNVESFKAYRYSKQFVVDEMDLIDDRFGGLNNWTPEELGEAARQVRPDLVYSVLFANAAMRDSVELFHADHGNLNTSSALAPATLKTAINTLNTQQENGRNLSKANGIGLLVPEALSFTADQLVNSAAIMVDGGLGNKNTLQSRNITPISDSRLDNGVTDPDSGTTHAGSGTTWFLVRPGGRHTIEVAYVEGSAKGPAVTSFMKNDGQWLLGWAVKLDIGVKALDWLGLQKNTA